MKFSTFFNICGAIGFSTILAIIIVCGIDYTAYINQTSAEVRYAALGWVVFTAFAVRGIAKA